MSGCEMGGEVNTKFQEKFIAKCRICKQDFNPNQNQIKKHDWICLSCRRVKEAEWRKRRKSEGRPVISTKMSREYHREYETKYYQREDIKRRRCEQQKKYRNDPRLQYKYKARWTTHHAITAGKLTPKPCEVCGAKKVDAHHDDYSKPLDVHWLCRKHHTEYHNKAEGREVS